MDEAGSVTIAWTALGETMPTDATVWGVPLTQCSECGAAIPDNSTSLRTHASWHLRAVRS